MDARYEDDGSYFLEQGVGAIACKRDHVMEERGFWQEFRAELVDIWYAEAYEALAEQLRPEDHEPFDRDDYLDLASAVFCDYCGKRLDQGAAT